MDFGRMLGQRGDPGEETQELAWRGRITQPLQGHGRADLLPEDLGQVVGRDSSRQRAGRRN